MRGVLRMERNRLCMLNTDKKVSADMDFCVV